MIIVRDYVLKNKRGVVFLVLNTALVFVLTYFTVR
jgi:hypothetical protein